MKTYIKTLVKQLGIIFSVAFILTLICSSVSLTAALSVSAILAVIGMVVGHVACWLCHWKRLKWILIGLGCILGLMMVGIVEENIRTKHNWDSHRAALEQKGEYFNVSHFVNPVADDQNFVMTPLLKPIMEFKHGKTGVVWTDTNAYSRVSKVRSFLEVKGKTNNIQAGSMERGTFANLESYQEFFKGNTNYAQPTKVGPAGEDVIIALSKFDAEINELKEAMKSRPLSYWPVHYGDTNESVWSVLLPHLIHVKELTVFCQLHGIAAADAGLSQMALDDFKLCLRLSDSIKNTPILIDHLVRISTLQITMQGIRDGLHRHVWNEQQILELEKHLATIDLLSEAKFSLRGERALSTAGIEQLRTGQVSVPEMGKVFNAQRKFNRVVSCVFYNNMLTISALHQELIDSGIDEKHHIISTNSPKGLKELAVKRSTLYNVFAKLLMPSYDRVTIKVGRIQTMVDAARIACSLERYRLEHGSYPESVVNGATDVMDGKPLRYRKTSDGGYVLYSVGWNGVDDGGVTGFKKNKVNGTDKDVPNPETGDWVWIMPK